MTCLSKCFINFPQAKSKQTTPIREGSEPASRISRSVPKEVRPVKPLKEETQAHILGLVKTNKETGQVEKINDMDYEDYMNIINKVRKTKELTRVRTEQARLASMYAQEAKRQEEIALEEERLKMERQRIEEEQRNPTFFQQPIMNRSQESLEKGQLDKVGSGLFAFYTWLCFCSCFFLLLIVLKSKVLLRINISRASLCGQGQYSWVVFMTAIVIH